MRRGQLTAKWRRLRHSERHGRGNDVSALSVIEAVIPYSLAAPHLILDVLRSSLLVVVCPSAEMSTERSPAVAEVIGRATTTTTARQRLVRARPHAAGPAALTAPSPDSTPAIDVAGLRAMSDATAAARSPVRRPRVFARRRLKGRGACAVTVDRVGDWGLIKHARRPVGTPAHAK